MSGIESTTATATPKLGPVGSSAASRIDGELSLLIPPSGDAETDALAILLMVQGQDRDQALETGRADLQNMKAQIREALAKMKAALNKATKAKKKSGFWGKVGKSLGRVGRWAAVGVAVAVAVASAGAAAPIACLAIAGAVLSTAGAAQGEWQVMDGALGSKAAFWAGLGMSAGGALCSGGASLLNLGNVDATVALAESVGDVAAGAATTGEGICALEQGAADKKAGHAEADASKERAAQAHVQRLIQWALEQMEDTEKDHQRKVRIGSETMSIQQETMMLAATRA